MKLGLCWSLRWNETSWNFLTIRRVSWATQRASVVGLFSSQFNASECSRVFGLSKEGSKPEHYIQAHRFAFVESFGMSDENLFAWVFNDELLLGGRYVAMASI